MSTPTRTTAGRQYRDTQVDVKLVLCVFAYVDIFGFHRADVLKTALDGRVATTGQRIRVVGWMRPWA